MSAGLRSPRIESGPRRGAAEGTGEEIRSPGYFDGVIAGVRV